MRTPSAGSAFHWFPSLGSVLAPGLVLLVVALSGVPAAAAPEDGAGPAALLDSYVEAWTTGSVDSLDRLVTADFRRHGEPGEACGSRAELAALIRHTHEVYGDVRLQVEDRLGAGDRAAYRGHFRGGHREARRVVEIPLMALLRFEDGRIAEEWVLGDTFPARAGLGYELLPPGFGAVLPSGEEVAPVGGPEDPYGTGATPGEPGAAGGAEGSFPPGARVPGARAQGSAAGEPAAAVDPLLARYLEVWNGGDVAQLADLVTEDFVRHGAYGRADSRQALERLITGYRNFYRDPRFELLDGFTGDGGGALRWRFTGGFGETAFVMDGTNMSMVRLEDGKIAEEWVQGNAATFWTSMGYRLLPPGTRLLPPPVEEPPGARVPPAPELAMEDLREWVEALRAAPPETTGEVTIRAGVDLRLVVDGTPLGALAAGEEVALPLTPGRHTVEAVSPGGSTFRRESFDLEAGGERTLDLEAPARTILRPRERTVEDLATGLMWPAADNGEDITQADAVAYCEALEQGGHGDWRLPSIRELETLYQDEDRGMRFRALDGVVLTACCPWTVSPYGDFHWTLRFYDGVRWVKYGTIAKASRAICVRHAAAE